MNSKVKKEIPSGRNALDHATGLRAEGKIRPVKKFQYLKMIRNASAWPMPIRQKNERSLYSRLKALSQRKIPRQQAPATPPICVREKKTKNAAPKAAQTHFCAAEPTRRNRIAAGTRN